MSNIDREKWWSKDLAVMDIQFQDRIKAVLEATNRCSGNERMQHYWANVLRELEHTFNKVRNTKRKISIDWDVDDVQTVRSDLTIDQSMCVLERVNKLYDPTIGVNWDTIRVTAYELYGTPRTLRLDKAMESDIK